MEVEFGEVTLILRVVNLDASLGYYGDALGFDLHWPAALPPHTLENVGPTNIRIVAVEIKSAARQ